MNAFTNPETIKRAQEFLNTVILSENQQTQQCPHQPVWYNHYTCNYGEIIIPQNIVVLESTINAIRVLLDAYAYICNCRIELQMQGYTDEDNMTFESTQFGIIFCIENGKINILRK